MKLFFSLQPIFEHFQIYDTRYEIFFSSEKTTFWLNFKTDTIFTILLTTCFSPQTHDSLWSFLTMRPASHTWSGCGQTLIQIYTSNLSGGVISRWRQFLVLFTSKGNKRGATSWGYNDVKKRRIDKFSRVNGLQLHFH